MGKVELESTGRASTLELRRRFAGLLTPAPAAALAPIADLLLSEWERLSELVELERVGMATDHERDAGVVAVTRAVVVGDLPGAPFRFTDERLRDQQRAPEEGPGQDGVDDPWLGANCDPTVVARLHSLCRGCRRADDRMGAAKVGWNWCSAARVGFGRACH
jgi:hypothetical protein